MQRANVVAIAYFYREIFLWQNIFVAKQSLKIFYSKSFYRKNVTYRMIL